MIKVRQKLSSSLKTKRGKRSRWNVGNLKTTEGAEAFKKRINEHFQSTNIVEETKKIWRNIREAITSAAKQALGEKSREQNEDWFDHECKIAIREKNEARAAMLNRTTRKTQGIYKEKRRIAKEVCRHEKKEALNKKLKNISDLHRAQNIHEMYKQIR